MSSPKAFPVPVPPKRRRFWRWLLALLLLLIVAGYIGRRLTAFPDVGEPFDVRGFASISVEPGDNAFVLYRKAKDAFVPAADFIKPDRGEAFSQSLDKALAKGWEDANPDVRQWLERNRKTIDLMKTGSERPNALEVSPASFTIAIDLDVSQFIRDAARLMSLECARLGAEGKSADAWTWHRAALRTSRHVGMHAPMVSRLIGVAIEATEADAVLRWSASPQVTAPELRQALVDATSIDEMTPHLSDTLKAEYVMAMNTMGTLGSGAWIMTKTGYDEACNACFANWLTQVDRPRYRRMSFYDDTDLFQLDPAAPPDPKLLPPERIATYCGFGKRERPGFFRAGAGFFRLLTPSIRGGIVAVDREQTRRAALILGLALQLSFREHGEFPNSLDDLVKSGYVKSVPADPFGKGEPFHYRRESDPKSGAILWSVWIDGIDQDGKVDADAQKEQSPGDKIFRIAAPGKGS